MGAFYFLFALGINIKPIIRIIYIKISSKKHKRLEKTMFSQTPRLKSLLLNILHFLRLVIIEKDYLLPKYLAKRPSKPLP